MSEGRRKGRTHSVPEWLRPWAWWVAGLALVLLGSAIVLAILSRDLPTVSADETWEGRFASALLLTLAPIVGALIATRKPESWYGWVWVAFGLGGGLLEFGSGYASSALAGLDLPVPSYMALLSGPGWGALFLTIPFVMLLFPNGHLPSPRWRHVARVTLVTGLVAAAAGFFVPGEMGTATIDNPLGIDGAAGQMLEGVVQFTTLVVLFMPLPAAVSLITRYRSASGVERQQIKWFAFAASLLVLVYASDWVWEFEGLVEALKEAIPIALMPVAIAVAILRHRLYDIDRILSRTVTYAGVTGSLVALFFSVVFLLQLVLPAESDLATAASTLAVAAAFNPLRKRVQDVVDRRFNRSRYDAARTVEQFSRRLRDATDVARLEEELRTTTATVMEPAHLSLWVQES